MSGPHESLTIRIVRKFLESNLSAVFILVSLAAGVIAWWRRLGKKSHRSS